MTVDTTASYSGPYSPNGVTVAFPFSFAVGSATELTVLIDDVEVDSGDYDVTLNAGNEGGTVTFAVAPTGDALMIESNPDFTQSIQFENSGPFLAESHDEALDRAAIKDIYLDRRIDVVQETLIEDFVTLYSLASLGSNSFFNKNEATAAMDDIPVGEMVQVYVDETKDFTWSIYRKVTGGLEYLFSLANTQDLSEDATGVLFNTAGAGNFTDMVTDGHASMTITDNQVAFSNAGAALTSVAGAMEVPDSLGNSFLFGYDEFTIDVTYTITSFVAAADQGFFAAGRDYTPGVNDGLYGLLVSAHGGINTSAFINATAGALILETLETVTPFPATVRVRTTRSTPDDEIQTIINVNGGADLVHTSPFGVGSFANSTRKLTAALRFIRGAFTVTNFKFSAANPNADFAFLGDSLTAWPQTGFAPLIRASHPSNTVLINGGSGSTTGDWAPSDGNMVESAVLMRPRYAFVMLGTNDVGTGVPLATIEANYAEVVSALLAEDIVPIILTTIPQGSAVVPLLNTWLKAQGWRYIDVYPLLVGVGMALNATYDYGDGIHLNDAGHVVVHDAIAAYITAQELV